MCHKCGKEGHNSRTCGQPQKLRPTYQTGERRKCSNCGKEGHYSSSCNNTGNSDVRACSYCGKLGHNVRTCEKFSTKKAQRIRRLSPKIRKEKDPLNSSRIEEKFMYEKIHKKYKSNPLKRGYKAKYMQPGEKYVIPREYSLIGKKYKPRSTVVLQIPKFFYRGSNNIEQLKTIPDNGFMVADTFKGAADYGMYVAKYEFVGGIVGFGYVGALLTKVEDESGSFHHETNMGSCKDFEIDLATPGYGDDSGHYVVCNTKVLRLIEIERVKNVRI